MTKGATKWVTVLLLICIFVPVFTILNPMVVLADDDEDNGMDSSLWPVIDFDEAEWTTAFPSNDPWEILSGEDKVEYIGGNRFSASLFSMLKQTVILFCMVVAFCCIIAIPWVNSSDGIKKNKENLVHTLLVMGFAFAAIPAFNFVKFVLDSMFGL